MFEKKGFCNITVLEKQRVQDKPVNEYSYLIDGRGQRATDSISVTKSIADKSVQSNTLSTLTEVLTTGRTNILKLPIVSKIVKYWLPRSIFMKVLLDEISHKSKKINIVFGAQTDDICVLNDGTFKINVSIDSASKSFPAALIVGADGINSGNFLMFFLIISL
jgi:2-polyprenyl-6-methoxyphenol hydroxylase-like FAD-dependent oxidoreductase